MHNGDAAPRRVIWSAHEPVSVFGAWRTALGHSQVDDLFGVLERSFCYCRSYAHEVLVAEVAGDMAYTVGIEHTTATVKGEVKTYTLRVTNIYRREAGEWKVVHRHGSAPPDE